EVAELHLDVGLVDEAGHAGWSELQLLVHDGKSIGEGLVGDADARGEREAVRVRRILRQRRGEKVLNFGGLLGGVAGGEFGLKNVVRIDSGVGPATGTSFELVDQRERFVRGAQWEVNAREPKAGEQA